MRGPYTRSTRKPFELTPRETAILSRVGSGMCNQEIATELSIKPTSVTHALVAIKSKVGVQMRSGLARIAIERGLTHAAVRPLNADPQSGGIVDNAKS